MSEHDLQALLDLVAKHLGVSWMTVSDWLRDQNSTDAIEQRIRAGDYQGVVQEVESAARRFAAATHSQFVLSGQKGAEWLDGELPDKLVRFDITNQRAVAAARQNELELVHGLTTEARQTAQQVIIDGTRAGSNPRTIARDIRDSITLTPNQAQHVQNYRRELEQGQYGAAVSRELSDGRSDRMLQRLGREGGALTETQIDSLVERYRTNYVAYRAETIARTEASRNVHAGLHESFQQAIDRGDVEASALQKEWIHAGRGIHSRPEHQRMDGKQVAFKEMFDVGGARMKYPGDPAGGAENTANCRCTYSTTLTGPPEQAQPVDAPDDQAPSEPAKNPRRQAAARVAAAASVERRREIHSAVATNLPQELQSTWDEEGHKFMREEAGRIKGVKDRVNAASTLSQAFAEKYGSGAETMLGNEGDRYQRRAEIEAQYAESWADEQERKYYAAAQERLQRGETDEDLTFAPPKTDSDDDPPF